MSASALLVPARPPLYKPQGPVSLDWSHPLARGLQAYYILNEVGRRTVQDLTNPGRNSTMPSTMNWKASPYGPLLTDPGNATTDHMTLSPSISIAGTAFSYEVMYWHGASVGAFSGLLASAGGGYGWYINANQFNVDNTAFVSATLTVGQYYHAVFTFNANANVIYVNGAQSTSGNSAAGFANPAVFTTWLGDDVGDAPQGVGHLWWRVWNRALSAAEVRALYLNPHGMLRAHTSERTTFAILATPPAGGGTAWARTVGPDAQSGLDTTTKRAIKALVDSLSGVDGLSRLITKPLGETQSALDSVMKTPGKWVSGDSLSGLDTRTSQIGKVLGEYFSGLDSQVKTPIKSLGDSHSALDSLAKTFVHTLVEKFSEVDSATASKLAILRLGPDTLSGIDSQTRVFLKLVADYLSALDGLSKVTNKSLGDSFSQLDSLSKLPAKTFLEWLSATDSVTATKLAGSQWARTITDQQSALDIVVKSVTKLEADNFSSIDLFSRVWQAHLTLTEWLSETDTWAKTVLKLQTDAPSSQDSLSKQLGKQVGDYGVSLDSLRKNVGRVLGDGTAATDTTVKAAYKTLYETLSETDQIAAGRRLLVALFDAAGLTDSVSQLLAHPLGQLALAQVVSLVAAALSQQISIQAGPTSISQQISLGPTSLSQSVTSF